MSNANAKVSNVAKEKQWCNDELKLYKTKPNNIIHMFRQNITHNISLEKYELVNCWTQTLQSTGCNYETQNKMDIMQMCSVALAFPH